MISSFVVAVGIALLSVSKKADDSIDWRFACGAIAAFAFPLLAAFVKVICLAFRDWESLLKAESWAFVTKRATETVVREVPDVEERSSVEFEKYFSEIMGKMVEWNNNIKFVFAIDNLDRIDGRRSLSLWSTLQTFLQRRSDSRCAEDWFKKVWILVPYDAEGLEKVWNLENGADDKKRAKSFLDKSFQVRVEVPRPVMTDWELYAQESISKVLGGADVSDQEDILRILKITRKGMNNIPTPREMKNYVNQVAVFRNQHDVAIATKTIAYYVIKRFMDQERMSTDKIRAGLLDGTFPIEKDRPYLPSDAARQLAGIVFGVSPEDGQQLLLMPEISAALSDSKSEDFNRLIVNHGDGALMAFDSYVSEGIQWNDEKDIGNFINVLSCLFSCEIASNRLRTLADKVTAYVYVMCEKDESSLVAFLPSDSVLVARVVACVKKLCELVDSSVAKRIHRQMLRTVGSIIGSRDDIDGTSLGLSASSVLGSFPESVQSEPEAIDFGAVKLAKFCTSLLHLDYAVAKQLRPLPTIASDIAKAIVPNAAIQPNLGRAIKYVIESRVEVDWLETINAAIKHIESHNGFMDQNIPSRRALDALLFIAPLDKKYRDSVAPLLKRGEFYNFVGSKPEERAHKAALLLAVCSPEGIKALSCDRQIGASQQGVKTIESVFKSESPDDARRLLELIQEFGVEESMRGFVANSGWQIFGTLIEFSMNESSYEWFNYDALTPLDSVWLYGEHLKRVSATDSELKIQKYVEFLQGKHKFIERVEEIGFSKADLQRCASYIKYILTRDGCSIQLCNNAASACKALDESALKDLMKEGDFRRLVILIREKVKSFELGVPFYKALRDVMSAVDEDCQSIRKNIISKCNGDEWSGFVGTMNESYKDSLVDDVTKVFVSLECADKPSYYSLNQSIVDVGKVNDAVVTDIVWQGLVNGKGRFDLLMLANALIEKKRDRDSDWRPSDESTEKLREPFERLYAQEQNESNQVLLRGLAEYYVIELPRREDKKEKAEDKNGGSL